MLASIADRILNMHGALALALVFALPALESSAFVGFVFPGEIAVVIGGVLAHDGRVPLWAVILAGILGAFIGDTIGYWVGREWGRKILHGSLGRLPIIKHHLHKNLDAAQEYLQRRGGSAVFFGRFTAALRVLVPGLAGMSQVPYPQFMFFNLLGGATWATTYVLLGYFAGQAWHRVEKVASWVGLGLLAFVLIAFVVGRMLRRARAHGRSLADILAALGPVAWVRRTFPIQSAWFARRTDVSTPMGFPLTFVVTAGALCGWAFGGLTEDVVSHNEMALRDPVVLSWMDAHRTAWLDPVMKAVTWAGAWEVLTVVLVLAGAHWVYRHGDWRPAGWLLVTATGAIAAYESVKQIVGRPRPPAPQMLVHAGGPAFPSGHATLTVAFYGMLALLLARGRPPRQRNAIWIVATLIALAVGASRLYLGVHWLTDVLAGYALGGLWLCVLLAVVLVGGGRKNGWIAASSPR